MKVAYLTVFQFSGTKGRYGRMHDVFEGFETCDPGFEHRVFALIEETGRTVLSRFGLDANDLWGSRLHNVEALLSARRTRHRLLGYEPDVIHVLTARPTEAAVARRTADRLGIPVVCGPNVGGWFPVRPNRYWETNRREALANRLNYLANRVSLSITSPDVVLAFSEYHRAMLWTVFDDDQSIVPLHPSVHPRFRPQPDTDRRTDLLYVGALSGRKGYPEFVDALDRIDGDRPLRVDVVGGEPDRAPTFETIDITFHGVVPRTELPAYYNRARLFVCLSSDEMGPNTLVEALACGTPALVSDEAGIREYLHGGNGTVCDRDDPADIARQLRACLRDADHLLANAAATAERYDVCRTIDQLETVYRDAVDGRSSYSY